MRQHYQLILLNVPVPISIKVNDGILAHKKEDLQAFVAPKQAEKAGVGLVMPRSVPASLAVTNRPNTNSLAHLADHFSTVLSCTLRALKQNRLYVSRVIHQPRIVISGLAKFAINKLK